MSSFFTSVTPLANAHLQRLVLENISDVIVITDLDFRIQAWNHVAERFYGHKAQDVLGKRIADVVSFTYHGTTQSEALRQLLDSKIWRGEVSVTAPGGETCFLLQTVTYVVNKEGHEVGVMAIGRNITDRKRVEEQLSCSEQFYRALIADSLDVILLMNAEGEITFSSPAIKNLLGYEAAEVIGTNGFGYIHPDDRAWAMQSFVRELEENPAIKFILVRLRRKAGDWLWCMVRGNNLLHKPQVHSIVVYIHDDTPRKLATDALKENERRFRKMIHSLQTGVVLLDAEGRVMIANPEAARIFERPEDAIIGRKMTEVCDDAIHEDGSAFLVNERPTYLAIQAGQRSKDVVMGIWSKSRKERRWLLINTDPIEDAGGSLQSIISTFTDITERKKQEKRSMARKIASQRQLAQATIDGQERERLEIGRELHDSIGQQLTSIKLFLDLARSNAEPGVSGLLDMALQSVSNVIDEVRSMSRSLVPPTLKDLGFADSVNDLVESLRTAQPITFEINYCDFREELLPENKKLALFRIVQEQLNNVLKYAQARNVHIMLQFTNGQVSLQIKDDGTGFDLATTRRGLGLTNIINRTELFGGSVEIVTSPGNGCTLNVRLPYSVVSSVTE